MAFSNQHFTSPFRPASFWSVRKRQTVAVGCDHRNRVRLEDQQTAIQRVTRLFHGNRKLCLSDQAFERRCGNFTITCGMTGSAGKFSLAIPTSLYFFLSLTISTQ